MDTFTVRDLRERTGELIRDAECGKLSVITKHGRPVFVAVPFDELLIREGIGLALAVRLFQQAEISLGKAARLAGMERKQFMAELSGRGIPVTELSEGELKDELEQFES
ncbi:MAG: type II toxin-antitoxin system prevent-host-death family antitoxin [Xanthomonadales bacterium]|nr:type II toxin-antitoxin system prevent-host-death family antitoxin [Xanthomonadales bacterium]